MIDVFVAVTGMLILCTVGLERVRSGARSVALKAVMSSLIAVALLGTPLVLARVLSPASGLPWVGVRLNPVAYLVPSLVALAVLVLPRRFRTRRLAKVLVLAVVVAGAWHLFGFTPYSSPETKIRMVFHRSFGRVVRVDMFAAGLETPMERHLFPLSNPYRRGDPITCAGRFPETWQDRNRDGKWDTWLRNLEPGPDGRCRTEYPVDTLGSGKPDWVFVAASDDYHETREAIVARRGF